MSDFATLRSHARRLESTPIARLLEDTALNCRMGEAAQQRVASEFSVDRQVAATLEVYERARARRKGSAA